MDAGNNIQSHRTEPQKGQSDSSVSFFRKYELLTTDETNGEAIFKKYAPLRNNDSETGIQPSREVLDLTVSDSTRPNAKRSNWRLPMKVFWVAATAVLILSGWMTVSLVRNGQKRDVQHSDSVNHLAAVEPPAAVSDTGRSVEQQLSDPLLSILGSSNEKQGDVKPAQAHRPASASSELLHNVMLARAREFEDRGMLSRAEDEYRAVAASFPGDTLSQVGLSRVQGVLSARRDSEDSRVKRENGLRSFRIGDYAGAARELSAAVSAGRADTASLYALGMSCLKLGNYSTARVTLERCLTVSPNYAPALVGLAETSVATGNRDQAVALLQRALELGGGAEFTPARIKDAISSLDPGRGVSKQPVSAPPMVRSQPAFSARATHSHDLILASCKGYLEIVNSVVHFNASNPTHSFHVLTSEISGARMNGNSLQFTIGGKVHRFTIQERPAKEFLDALAY